MVQNLFFGGGEGFLVTRKNLLALAAVMNLAPQKVTGTVEEEGTQAGEQGALAKSRLPPKALRPASLKVVASKVDVNIAALKAQEAAFAPVVQGDKGSVPIRLTK